MAYGTIKVDTVTFTDGGIDKSVSISGLVQNPTFSGNITVTGTISGDTLQGQTVSGITVTGTTATFASGVFITQISGATITGNAAAFTTITGGVATITSGVFALGTNSLPSISFSSDPNTGIYSPGADQVAISTSGTQRINIDSSGRLLVGTPSSAVDSTVALKGNSGLSAHAILYFESETTNPSADGPLGVINFTDSAENRGAQIAAIADEAWASGDYPGRLVFSTTADGESSPTERLRIDSSGRVGVGSAAPSKVLTIANADPVIRFEDTGGGAVHLDANAGGFVIDADPTNATGSTTIQFKTDGGERARIDSSGRLLVGTSSARTDLIAGTRGGHVQIEAASSDAATAIDKSSLCLTAGTTAAAGGSAYIFFTRTRSDSLGGVNVVSNNDVLGGLYFQGTDGTDAVTAALIKTELDGDASANDMPGRLVFSTTADGASSPTEAMRINNAGELLVGYTSDNGAYKLQVNSQIFATSATIATSDGRYKENVATLDGCVDLVKALRPVSFDWKHQEPITRIDEEGETVVVREAHNFPDGTQVGFIAQEVETVFADKPWLSSIIKQNVRPAVTDNDGNELAPEEEFLGIAEGNLMAVLTSALKDAIGRIESLEIEVAALKA